MPVKPKKKRTVGAAKKGRAAPKVTISSVNDPSCLKLKLKLLHRVNEIADGPFDLDTVLERIMDLVIEIAPSEAGSLALASGGVLTFVAVNGPAASKLAHLEVAVGQGIAGWVAKTGVPLVVNDPVREPKWKREIAASAGFTTRNILCVPLKRRGEIIGVIELVNKRGGAPFDADDREIMELLGAQVAALIENSRLFTETKNRAERMGAVAGTAALIASSLDVKRVLETVMAVAKDVLGAEASTIFMYDAETKSFTFDIATGEAGEAVKQVRVPWGKGMAGWAAKRLATLVVPDVSKDRRFYAKVDEVSGFRTRNAVSVPLTARDRLIGVAQVLNKKEGTFTKDDVELFETIARIAGVAIDNARLYSGLEELFYGTIRSLVSLIDAKDDYTAGHSARVATYALLMADAARYTEADRKRLELAALLHDVGKIGMPDAILKKATGLSDEEFVIVKDHPQRGATALEPIARLRDVIPGVRCHHEKIDGSGYPRGLKGEEIPLDAQIICIADSFDAMNSDRPYRKGLGAAESLGRLRGGAGAQFNAALVAAFANAFTMEPRP
jgi:HD-GYP domain-containing protein (c-di-GMP phosphodiesterase class II)